MSTTSMSGSWRGVYEYDPQLKVDFRVEFVLELQSGAWTWLNGGFQGTVQDLNDGVPGVGTIRGHCFLGKIRFVKTMPVAYGLEQGKAISFKDSLNQRGYRVEEEIKGFPIIYTGKRISENEAAGLWIIPSFRFKAGRVVGRNTGTCSGRWTMRRS